MLEAMVDTLTDPDFDPPLHTNHRIDSRIIVRACTEYAMAIGRVPSIGELRRSAHVSERRLREAFLDLFGMPPTRYFRAWGLNQVHSRLVESNPGSRSVTQVASSVGFTHLGRFAAQYRQVYGEVPSHTLRT
jgi:AraC family ethanolamine operon transcriptional activator